MCDSSAKLQRLLAHWGNADNDCPVARPQEMLRPNLTTRVKKRDELTSFRIDGSDTAAFVLVSQRAG
jgi:hypothetical protein